MNKKEDISQLAWWFKLILDYVIDEMDVSASPDSTKFKMAGHKSL